MPTILHESMVQQCVDAGYRVNGAQEFARLAFYLHEELGLAAESILLELFKSDKLINHHNAKRVAKKVRESQPNHEALPDYLELRFSIPAPNCRPDAWIYRPSHEIPGAMVLEFVEVFDTCRTEVPKLAQYGRAFNDHSFMQFMVFEIGAKDGAQVRHDPFYALQLCAGREVWEMLDDVPVADKEIEALYAAWLQGDRRILPTALLERHAA